MERLYVPFVSRLKRVKRLIQRRDIIRVDGHLIACTDCARCIHVNHSPKRNTLPSPRAQLHRDAPDPTNSAIAHGCVTLSLSAAQPVVPVRAHRVRALFPQAEPFTT